MAQFQTGPLYTPPSLQGTLNLPGGVEAQIGLVQPLTQRPKSCLCRPKQVPLR